MKVTLLLENHSLFDKYYNAEHGYSAWLEDGPVRVLYDMGYSDKFIRNAEMMGIDLRQATHVVLSHPHNDHAGGLKYLIKYYQENAMYRKPIMLLADEEIFKPRYSFETGANEGLDVSREIMEQYFDIQISNEPVWITQNLVFMGITEISNDFERSFAQVPKKLEGTEWVDDYVLEDTYLAWKHKGGKEVSIVAACAHYGICNIMEYAKKLTGATHVNTYLGGSHLRAVEVPERQMALTCEYVKKEQISHFYICHDTDLACTLRLASVCPVEEAGVGLSLEWF